MMRTADLTVYLAHLGAAAVGTATVMVMPNVTYDCAPTVFIEAVVVVPEHRRKGVATAILERILDDSRAAGCNKVQLLSHKRHAVDGAHALYVAAGFTAEAEGFRCYLEE
jgi:GNAT superfamily N-acetyltransferase